MVDICKEDLERYVGQKVLFNYGGWDNDEFIEGILTFGEMRVKAWGGSCIDTYGDYGVVYLQEPSASGSKWCSGVKDTADCRLRVIIKNKGRG